MITVLNEKYHKYFKCLLLYLDLGKSVVVRPSITHKTRVNPEKPTGLGNKLITRVFANPAFNLFTLSNGTGSSPWEYTMDPLSEI